MAYNTAILLGAAREAQQAMPQPGDKSMVFPIVDFGTLALLSRCGVAG